VAAFNLATGNHLDPNQPWTAPGWDYNHPISGFQNLHDWFDNWYAKTYGQGNPNTITLAGGAQINKGGGASSSSGGGSSSGGSTSGGSTSGGSTSGGCAAGDTTCQLANAFSQLAAGGAPQASVPDTQPTVVPTQTGGTQNPLPGVILIGAALGFAYYYYKKHKNNEHAEH
jgi:hypothetical protein